ncbi:MAG: hypothetical protein V3V78_00245 [Candidatus Woesearchaeota archaeon]
MKNTLYGLLLLAGMAGTVAAQDAVVVKPTTDAVKPAAEDKKATVPAETKKEDAVAEAIAGGDGGPEKVDDDVMNEGLQTWNNFIEGYKALDVYKDLTASGLKDLEAKMKPTFDYRKDAFVGLKIGDKELIVKQGDDPLKVNVGGVDYEIKLAEVKDDKATLHVNGQKLSDLAEGTDYELKNKAKVSVESVVGKEFKSEEAKKLQEQLEAKYNKLVGDFEDNAVVNGYFMTILNGGTKSAGAEEKNRITYEILQKYLKDVVVGTKVKGEEREKQYGEFLEECTVAEIPTFKSRFRHRKTIDAWMKKGKRKFRPSQVGTVVREGKAVSGWDLLDFGSQEGLDRHYDGSSTISIDQTYGGVVGGATLKDFKGKDYIVSVPKDSSKN